MTDEKEQTDSKKKGNNTKPISLHPLSVKDVVKAMLDTPPPKKERKTPAKKSP